MSRRFFFFSAKPFRLSSVRFPCFARAKSGVPSRGRGEAMRLLSVPLALLFAVVVVANVSAGEDEKEKGKKGRLIRGRVEEVHKDKDKDSGYI